VLGIAGVQGIIDHVMVGHYVGYTGNAAIGVSWQVVIVVIVFMSSLFTGMGVLVARFAGANEPEKVNRVVEHFQQLHENVTYLQANFIFGLDTDLIPGKEVTVRVCSEYGTETSFQAIVRIDSGLEMEQYRNGGILPYILRKMLRG